MKIFEGLAAAADAVKEFYYTNKAALPEHVATRIAGLVGTGQSPVDLIVTFTEAVYANRDQDGITPEAMEVAAGCALVIHQHGFHSDLNGRAARVQQALRRDSGERAPNGSGGWPAKDKDPAPADGYAAPEPAEAAEETE